MAKKQVRASIINIRVSPDALLVLDQAAKQRKHSRNAEAVARLEASLVGAGNHPRITALQTFTRMAVARAMDFDAIVNFGLLPTVLEVLKGTVLELQAAAPGGTSAAIELLGETAGRKIVSDARRALALDPNSLSELQRELAGAASALGLQPLQDGEDGNVSQT